MVDIWIYNDGDRIRISDIDDETFEGRVWCITEKSERSVLEKQEDGICLQTDDGRHIEFYLSEIKSIELMTPVASSNTG